MLKLRMTLVVICISISTRHSAAQVTVIPPGEPEERQSQLTSRLPSYGEADLPDLKRDASVRRVLRYAFLANAEVRTAYNEWLAAIERVTMRGSLMDPSLSLGLDLQWLLGFDPMEKIGVNKGKDVMMKAPGEKPMRTRMMEHQGSGRLLDALRIGFEQEIPGAGKRETRAEEALYEAQAAGRRYAQALIELRRRVIAAYAELLHIRHRIEVEEENVELLGQINEITVQNLAAGVSTRADALKSEITITEGETELRAMRIAETRLRAELNALLSRKADAEFGPLTDIEPQWKAPSKEKLVTLAISRNPELQALAAELRARGAGVLLAELEYNPDFMVGLDLRAMEQMLMAGMSLPVYTDRIEAGIRESMAMCAATQSKYSDRAYMLLAQMVTALASIEDAERILEDYGQRQIPQLRELMEVQLTGYGAGEDGFLEVLDTRRMFVQTQRLVMRAQADRLKAMAQVETIAGEPLMRLETVPYAHTRYEAVQVMDVETTVPEESLQELDATTTAPQTAPAVVPRPATLPPLETKPRRRDSGTTIGQELDRPKRFVQHEPQRAAQEMLVPQ